MRRRSDVFTRKSEIKYTFWGFDDAAARSTLKGDFLQRLYSTFARGWPGTGLVILRVGAGVPMIYFAMETLLGAGTAGAARAVLDLVAGIAGILLIVGLWTPIAGAVVAVVEALICFSRPFANQSHPLGHLLLIVLGLGLCMLGPGTWSIDARLFGRKLLIRD